MPNKHKVRTKNGETYYLEGNAEQISTEFQDLNDLSDEEKSTLTLDTIDSKGQPKSIFVNDVHIIEFSEG